ncbi:phosphate-binding protein PstS 2 [Clostridia bacterium]|nr:phosphate-binding protein PstS 2 [Clostridia bacterium]
MKKLAVILAIAALGVATLVGCGTKDDADTSKTGSTTGGEIQVISREDGSGTRGAFIELFGVEEKDADGKKVDKTTEEATIVNNTEAVLTGVAGNKDAIGYVSLGSLKDTVKALKINGVDATVANIKDGSYEISRPFNIATKGTPSEVTQDFINFILSKDGQDIIEKNGYIKTDDSAKEFTSNKASGKILIAGSSSVSPVMEKLIEAYEKVNTAATLDLNTNDSTTGIQAAIDGTADIAMSSRELKDSESELKATQIALDGIVIVVNKDNATSDLTKDVVKEIFTGAKTEW